jgi:hypothetical protein
MKKIDVFLGQTSFQTKYLFDLIYLESEASKKIKLLMKDDFPFQSTGDFEFQYVYNSVTKNFDFIISA